MDKTSIYIDGRWLDIEAERHVVTNATTGAAMATIPLAAAEHVDQAVRAARHALPGWAEASPESRGRVLQRIADGLQARAAELASLITAEVGMPLRLSEAIQVSAPIAAWRAYAELAARPQPGRIVGHSTVTREPVGVVGAITPWNYPLHQVTAKVAAALAAGATVVLKPSEIAPLSVYVLGEVIAESGLPPGAFNLVTGTGMEVGRAIVEHPDVAAVSFTGSTETGRRVASLAAQHLKRLSLELGGKSPAVVLEGADLVLAIKTTLSSCLLNSGQTCNALTRLVIPESQLVSATSLIRDMLAKYTVGDPMDRNTRVGPLATAQQRDRVLRLVADAIASGAPVIARGRSGDRPADGFFVEPVVIGPVGEDSALVQEEIFGPVLVVQTHVGTEDAIRLANCTPYGLAAAVFAQDDDSAAAVARHIRAGQIDLNGAPFNPAAPFGGFGASGIGRENGEFGMLEFLETKSVQRRAPR